MSKRKSETDTVTIRVHPAVRRWMENTFPKAGGAYDLRGHFLHDFLRTGLSKEVNARAVPEAFQSLPEIKVAVSRRDCRILGDRIPEPLQAAFSQLAYKYIRQTACQGILFAHLAGGVPRDTTIKEYLLAYLYEDDELNYPALRKYYQRNWMETERRVLEEYSTETDRKQLIRGIIISSKNVPFHT